MKIGFALVIFPVLILPAQANVNFSPVLNNIGSALAGLAGEQSARDDPLFLTLPDSTSSTMVGLKNVGIEKAWGEIQRLGPQAGRVVLAEATKVYSEAAHALEQFQNATEKIIIQAHKTSIYEDLKDIVNDPLPQDRGERARVRARIVNQIMDQIGLAYIRVLTEVGVPQEEATVQFSEFAPKLVHVILIIGNIADEHPKLMEILVFVVSMTVLPEIPIFRPILTLLGFGPLGPVKGTAAAWAQETFFGGAVSSGSWFSMLQSAGMTDTLQWLDRVVVSAGLTAIVGHAIEKRAKL